MSFPFDKFSPPFPLHVRNRCVLMRTWHPLLKEAFIWWPSSRLQDYLGYARKSNLEVRPATREEHQIHGDEADIPFQGDDLARQTCEEAISHPFVVACRAHGVPVQDIPWMAFPPEDMKGLPSIPPLP